MTNRRCLRVARAIKETVSRVVLYELGDPRLGFITVTGVDVAPDMRTAAVKVSVLGDETKAKLCLKALQHALGKIQGEVNTDLQIKIVPRIRFELDDTVKKHVEISRLIQKAASEYRETNEDKAEDEAEADEAGEAEEEEFEEEEKERDQ